MSPVVSGIKFQMPGKLAPLVINSVNRADIPAIPGVIAINRKNKYINKTLVTMRYGGSSNKTIYNILNQNLSITRVLNINFNILKLGIFLFSKLFERLSQFIKRPNKK